MRRPETGRIAALLPLSHLQSSKKAFYKAFFKSDQVDLGRDLLETLVKAGAFDGVGERPSRRKAFYSLQTLAHARKAGTHALLSIQTQAPDLADLSPGELLTLDFTTTGISGSGQLPLDAHRARLRDIGCVPLSTLRHGQQVWTAGQIVARQRPPTARGFAFYVLEDRHTRVQAIISPDLWEAHRALLRDAGALIVQGEASVRGQTVTVRVDRLCELPLGRQGNTAD